MSIRAALRWLLIVAMVLAGLNHFRTPAVYVAMMPDALPRPLELVYISGVFEILGGLGLVFPRTRRLAGWGLIALFIAVFPANLNMAIHHLPLGDRAVPAWALWARLPLQAVLIAWAWWVSREPSPRRPDQAVPGGSLSRDARR
jgi:uncharacterized membrane protein